jgi:iron complex outermembrane receptor protein
MNLLNKTTLLFLSIFLFAASAFAQQNTGNIKGIIKTNDNKPAASVTIHLLGTKKYTATKDDGTFYLKNVSAGDYVIEVSLVGYQPQKQDISIDADKTTAVNLQLRVQNNSYRTL